MKTWTELAEIAYHAYGQSTDFKNFQGNPMPEWSSLPESIQQAWIAAVIAVYQNIDNWMEPSA